MTTTDLPLPEDTKKIEYRNKYKYDKQCNDSALIMKELLHDINYGVCDMPFI